MPNLSTNTYILELCVSALHRGHAKYFKSLTCHQNRGHATLLLEKRGMYVSSLHKGPRKISLRKKKKVQLTPCRRENRHSCEGSPVLCGRFFRDIRTFGRAVEGSSVSPLTNTVGGLSGGGRGSDMSGVCSAPSLIISRLRARALALDLGCGTCCPPFVIRKADTIEGSSTPRRKSPAMCGLSCSTRCARRSTSLASVLGASMLLARGASWSGAELPHSLLQLQCCFQRSLEGENDRVQAEHDACFAFLALDFFFCTDSLDSAVHAPLIALVRSSPRCSPSTTSTPPRVLVPAPSSPPDCAGTPPTFALLGVCAFCFGLALDCASGFVVDSTSLCHCFGHALRAWNQIRLEHGGGELSQFCRVDQRQSRQHVHQAPSDVSVDSPFCHRLSHRSTACPVEPLLACACPKKASRSSSFLKTSHKCSAICCWSSDQFLGSAEQTGHRRDSGMCS